MKLFIHYHYCLMFNLVKDGLPESRFGPYTAAVGIWMVYYSIVFGVIGGFLRPFIEISNGILTASYFLWCFLFVGIIGSTDKKRQVIINSIEVLNPKPKIRLRALFVLTNIAVAIMLLFTVLR
jgi:hypothetical protein